MIANFFAEKARMLDEEDIENFSNNIEISKIEIYEEDVKRYHESLKYIRGPVSHDIIFTTVETALNFIEKLVKERDQKRKVGFFPELFERCLKSKVSLLILRLISAQTIHKVNLIKQYQSLIRFIIM